MGRVWRARAEMQLGRPERAWQLLEHFCEDGPETPTWGHLWVEVSRGQIQDTMGEREKALAHYQRIVALKLNPTFNRSAEIAAKGVKEPFQRSPGISAQDP